MNDKKIGMIDKNSDMIDRNSDMNDKFVTIRTYGFDHKNNKNIEHLFNPHTQKTEQCSKCKKYVTSHFSEYARQHNTTTTTQ